MKKYLILFLISLTTQQLTAQSEKSLFFLELNMEYQYFKISIEDSKDLLFINDNLSHMGIYVKNSKEKVNQVELKKKTKKKVLDYLEFYTSIKEIQVHIGIKNGEKAINILNSIAFELRKSLDNIYQNTFEKEFIKELDLLSGIYASGKKFYPLYESSQDLLSKHKKLINQNYSLLNMDYPQLNKFINLVNKKGEFSNDDLERISNFYNTELKTEYLEIIEDRLKN